MLYFVRCMPVALWLLFSLPARLTTVTEFCTVSRRKSFLDLRSRIAVRPVVSAGKYQHITSVLRDVFHWLPVCQRILFKVAFAVAAVDYVCGGAMPTSKTSAYRSLTTPIVRLNVMTCWFLRPGLISANRVFTSQLLPSGTGFRHTRATPPLAVDSVNLTIFCNDSTISRYDRCNQILIYMRPVH